MYVLEFSTLWVELETHAVCFFRLAGLTVRFLHSIHSLDTGDTRCVSFLLHFAMPRRPSSQTLQGAQGVQDALGPPTWRGTGGMFRNAACDAPCLPDGEVVGQDALQPGAFGGIVGVAFGNHFEPRIDDVA